MYPLGKQFEVDYTKAVSDKKAVVLGSNFRISVQCHLFYLFI